MSTLKSKITPHRSRYLLFGLLFTATVALAYDEVTVNGNTYWCSNTCEVTTYGDGSFSISDCCGGRVGTRMEP